MPGPIDGPALRFRRARCSSSLGRDSFAPPGYFVASAVLDMFESGGATVAVLGHLGQSHAGGVRVRLPARRGGRIPDPSAG